MTIDSWRSAVTLKRSFQVRLSTPGTFMCWLTKVAVCVNCWSVISIPEVILLSIVWTRARGNAVYNVHKEVLHNVDVMIYRVGEFQMCCFL